MNGNKQNTNIEWIDTDDAPELTDDFFDQADEYKGKNLIRSGRACDNAKSAMPVYFDMEVIEAFRAMGEGWQSRMNDVLRDWLTTHTPAR